MSAQDDIDRSIRRHLSIGLAVVFALFFGVGGWAATASLSGAVMAPGQLVVESDTKKVQHPTGGVVRELMVREGDRVSAGQVVLRLDDTQTRASLGIVTRTLDEMSARRARLEAEREGNRQIAFPVGLLGRLSDPEISRLISGEERLFELRRSARTGQKDQLRQRIAQLEEEIGGQSGQLAAKEQEIALNQKELAAVRELFRKNLIPINRVTAVERDAARLQGERGLLMASRAQARGRISETELQILQIDNELRTEVARELAEIRAKTSEYTERKIAAEDQLRRIDVRAPQNGRVHQLAVHTVGGVVGPGEAIMLVVPVADALVVEAKIAPRDIDQLHIGQHAVLRFSAFNQRTTPELNGTVSRISPDITVDQKTGVSYYTVRIGLSDGEMGRLGKVELVPGMPVEAFVQTGDRTVISYIVKPFSDQLRRSFRES